MSSELLTTREFAEEMGISEHAAWRAAHNALKGQQYRGHTLRVAAIEGVGRGGKQLLILRDSLPLAIASDDRNTNAASPRSIGTARQFDQHTTWRERLVVAVIRRMREADITQSEAIAEACRTAFYPSGAKEGASVSPHTLQTWVAEYRKRGVAGVARKIRRNKGAKAVIATEAIDAALRAKGVSDDGLRAVRAAIEQLLKDFWACHGMSRPQIQMYAKHKVAKILEPYGFKFTDDKHPMLKLPDRLILEFQHYRVVGMMKADAGRFHKEVMPKGTRDRSNLSPMQWVAADVHHADIYVLREDGSKVTPKFITLMDLATNRVFIHVVLCEPGTSIRREDVTEAFAIMCADPNFGVPENLYLDNGSEFSHLTRDAVNGLLRLNHQVRVADFSMLDQDLDDYYGVHRSLPYCPWSKVIETFFAGWERLSRPLDGALEGLRELSPSTNLGQAPKAHGALAKYAVTAREVQATYHNKPQSGHLKGLTPNQAFRNAIDAGWTSTVCDPLSLALAIMPRERQRISAGKYTHNKTSYQCNEALGATKSTAFLRVESPILHDRTHIILNATTGKPVGYARPVVPTDWISMEGAKQTAMRRRICLNNVRALDAETSPVDMLELMRGFNALAGPEPQAPVGKRIDVDPNFTAAAAALREASTEAAPISLIDAPSTERAREAYQKLNLRPRSKRIA